MTPPRARRTPRPSAPTWTTYTRADDAAAIEELLASLDGPSEPHTSLTPRMSGYLIATG